MFLGMVLRPGVKQRVSCSKKRTGWSYCDFLMFVHQRTREDNGHQYGKRFFDKDSQISEVAMHL